MRRRWVMGALAMYAALGWSGPALAQDDAPEEELRPSMLGPPPSDAEVVYRLSDGAAKHQDGAVDAFTDGDWALALERYEVMLAYIVETEGEWAPTTITTRAMIAVCLSRLMRNEEALELLDRIEGPMLEVYGADHSNYATYLNNKAELLARTGAWLEAIASQERVVAFWREREGGEGPFTLWTRCNLAQLHMERGDLWRAENEIYAILLVAQDHPKVHPYDMTIYLGVYSTILSAQQKFVEAIEIIDMTVPALEVMLGEAHPRTLSERRKRASARSFRDDHDEAIAELREIWALGDSDLLSPNEKASTAYSLGVALGRAEKLDEAATWIERAWEIERELLGEDNPSTLQTQATLGVMLHASGERERSTTLTRTALSALERTLGATHPDVMSMRANLVYMLHAESSDEEAWALSEVIREQMDARRTSSLISASTSLQMLRMLEHQRNVYDLQMSLSSRVGATRVAFEQVLRRQGVGLLGELALARESRVLSELEGNDEARRTYGLWRELVEREDVLEAVAAHGTPSEQDALELADLSTKRAAYATTLALASPSFVDHDRTLSPSGAAICAHLKADPKADTLVTFASYSIIHPSKPRTYATVYDAFVMRTQGKGECALERVRLGSKRQIDALVSAWRGALDAVEARAPKRSRALERALDSRAAAIHRFVWSPIEQMLEGQQTLYVSAEGALARVPFGALRARSLGGEGLMEGLEWGDDYGPYLIEKHDIRMLAAPAALLRPPPKTPPGTGAFVAGAFDFSRASASALVERCDGSRCDGSGAAELVANLTADAPEREGALRGAPTCGFEAKSWLPVGEDRPTLRALSKTLSARTGGETVLALGELADEHTLERAMEGKRVLHLSTHGFYAPIERCGVERALAHEVAFDGSESDRSAFDPLQLSALVLPGANASARRRAAGEEVDTASDGLLTAREISGMNLEAVQVATLAACETGRGEQIEGEGQLGLARGLLSAGVREVVASAWRVPDARTSALMRGFYDGLDPAGGAWAAHDALRAAQLEMVADERARGREHSAFSWGAFTSISTVP